MTVTKDFNLGGLIDNPNFDFIKILSSNLDNDNDNESLPFIISDDIDSPYNNSIFNCNYVDHLSICSSYLNNNVNIMSLNVQSLSAKFSELKDLLNHFSTNNFLPEIILLQEIWQITDPNIFQLDHYQPLISKCRSINRGGGVGIYVKNGINFNFNNNSVFLENVLESVLIDVSLGNRKFTVGSLYRCIGKHPTLSARDQFSTFNDLLANMLDNLSSSELILGGDINLDVLKIKSCRNTETYVNNLFTNGCLQIICKPTRCNDTSATCIDHFITNVQQQSFNTRILLNRISDHFPIFFSIDYPKKKSPVHSTVTYCDFSPNNVNQFVNSLHLEDWNNVISCNDPNVALDNFTLTFKANHSAFFTKKERRFNKNIDKKEKWMTKGLLTSRLKKFELSKICSHTPTPDNVTRFKLFRNMYNRLIRISRKMFFEEQLSANKNNLRKTWQILNDALNISKNKQKISQLTIDNNLISDPIVIANKFNEFFTSVAGEISSKINPCPDNVIPTVSNTEFVMSSVPITHLELSSALNDLQSKKSTDLNDISMHLVKTAFLPLSAPLLHIFNKSIELGVVPDKFKIAKVVPVFKSGDPFDMNNYRPISLLCSFSKILEKIVFNRLMLYLTNHDLLSKDQFGFRPRHSTYHPMLDILIKASNALNKKKHMLIIFCDLKKAFDTCDVGVLLGKLRKLGVVNTELAWFESYLSGRSQFVNIYGHYSVLLQILTGVPQGSILGPLLFLIYINDLPECSEFLSKLFADDTALILFDDDLNNLVSKANSELQKVCRYFRINKLSLHPDKTKYIIISNSKIVHETATGIFINNNNVDQNDPRLVHEIKRVLPTDKVPAIKYLGVYFDPNLNFKYHVQQLSAKLSRALFQIRRVKNILSSDALKILYYSLFHCHIVYAIEIWSLA
jgi:hypothetical protein